MLQLTLTGHLGADATTKEINGTTYLTYNVGVSNGKDSTLWVTIMSRYQEGSKVLNALRKGTKVLVQGMPSLGAYTNKNGKAIGTITLWARETEILQWAEEQKATANEVAATPTSTTAKKDEDEESDLPF